MHAVKKYILEDKKEQISWLFTLLAMILLFSNLTFPSLKLALHDSFLFTTELHSKTRLVPPLLCSVTNLWQEDDAKFSGHL